MFRSTISIPKCRGRVFSWLWVAALVITPPLPSLVVADPLAVVGRWTVLPDSSWKSRRNNPAVYIDRGAASHMALLRGINDSTRVLYWHEDYDPSLWMFDANRDSTSPSVIVPTPTIEHFCGGQVSLGDGRLFVAGGELVGESGIKSSAIFDAKLPLDSAHGYGWANQDSMRYDRWYPTGTILGDGKIILTGGWRYDQVYTFGGITQPGEAMPDSTSRLHLGKHAGWSPDLTATSHRPMPREGHAAVLAQGRSRIFGGRSAVGDTLGDLWALAREEYDTGTDWFWYKGSDVGQDRPDSTYGRPIGRSRHTAVIVGDSMIVFGGITKNPAQQDSVLSDVWVYNFNSYRWRRVFPAGSGPGPRYAHAAVLDAGSRAAKYPLPLMLVFGGRTTGKVFADSTAWALSFPRVGSPGTLSWSIVGASSSVFPMRREGHVAVLDPSPVADSTQRMVLFGGQGPGGLLNDAWLLTRSDSPQDSVNIGWSWRQFPLGDTTKPAPRTRHAALNDTQWNRLLAFGGDVNGDSTAGGQTNDLWQLSLDFSLHNSNPFPVWSRLASDSLPGARAGLIMLFDASPVLPKIPERFDPGATAGQQWQDISQPKILPFYPHMFLLRSGKVLYAGNDGSTVSHVFDPATGWSRSDTSGFIGGSSVMYAADSVMKCAGPYASADDRTGTIDMSVTSPAWSAAPSMQEKRTFSNITTLPDGKVLLTGGYNAGGYTRNPRLWDPATRQWGVTPLAAEPSNREYHSTAILLPDGRVLSAGGQPTPLGATIFWPPYLFTGSGDVAKRPVVTGAPDTIYYNQTFSVYVDTASLISKVSLIRPGAVTHAFNQNQRFLALRDSLDPGSSTHLIITAPADSNWAPPGDYLLFLVSNRAVPSIARWVRLKKAPAGGGCPFVDTRTAGGWRDENSILGRSLTGALALDVYRLKATPDIVNGRYQLRLRENEQENTILDAVGLVTVDHDPSVRVYSLGDRFVLGSRLAPYRAVTSGGVDVTNLVSGGTGYFTGAPGETLLVDLLPPGAGVGARPQPTEGGLDPVIIEPGGKHGDDGGDRARPIVGGDVQSLDLVTLSSTGIEVQGRDATGVWQSVRRVYPREDFDEGLIDTLDSGPLRLVFVGRHRLRFVGRVLPVAEVAPQSAELVTAHHTRLGDAMDAVRTQGGPTRALVPGDTLTVEFAASPVPRGQTRDYFLVTRGVYSSVPAPLERFAASSNLPRRFALLQNKPNPFDATTRIDFELPRASHVTLEVFDVQGRRVVRLADAQYAAGRWSVDWDHRVAGEGFAEPGLYFYRMKAEDFRAHKKLVVLP